MNIITTAVQCEAVRYAPDAECSETPPKYRVVYRTSTGQIASSHPTCFRHGMKEVDRHHASAGMGRCDLEQAPVVQSLGDRLRAWADAGTPQPMHGSEVVYDFARDADELSARVQARELTVEALVEAMHKTATKGGQTSIQRAEKMLALLGTVVAPPAPQGGKEKRVTMSSMQGGGDPIEFRLTIEDRTTGIVDFEAELSAEQFASLVASRPVRVDNTMHQ